MSHRVGGSRERLEMMCCKSDILGHCVNDCLLWLEFFVIFGQEQQSTLLLMCKEAAGPVIARPISKKVRLVFEEGKERGIVISFCNMRFITVQGKDKFHLMYSRCFVIIGSDVWFRYTVCTSHQVPPFFTDRKLFTVTHPRLCTPQSLLPCL